MKLNLKTILIIVLLFISTVVIIWGIRKNNQVKAEKAKYRTEKIKADKLQKVVTEKGVQYEKLVADTVGTGQLRRIIKELGIDIKNPQLAQEIIFVPRDTITIIKEIEATDSTLVFTDYYPQKENYFAKHITRQDTRDTTATGEFSFNPIKLSLSSERRTFIPACSNLSPPKPSNSAFGFNVEMALTRFAPCISPEASPAITKNFIGRKTSKSR